MVAGLKEFTARFERNGVYEPVLDAENGEELMHVQPGVSIVLSNRPPKSPGTLYISTKQVVWLSDVDRENGYTVDFLSISLHVVSKDPEAYTSPCVYTQIETEGWCIRGKEACLGGLGPIRSPTSSSRFESSSMILAVKNERGPNLWELPLVLTTILLMATAMFRSARRSFSFSAGHDDARKTTKWEKITYLASLPALF
ncbi:hypothetical protein ACFX11_024875 [Malus domestica]